MTTHFSLPRDGSALDRLAVRFGIELEFIDAHENRVTTSLETRKRLLADMGVAVETDAEATAALEALERSDAARPLAPVVVLRPGQTSVDVNIAPDTARLEWRVHLEDGKTMGGADELLATGRSAHGRSLTLPDLPLGYHRLELPALAAEATLIVSPGVCWRPAEASAGRWGIIAQLYLIRSARNWGMGDFTDLAGLVKLAGERGCAVVGLNPLHQMFLDDPEHASPYSPASRLFLNPLYIDVTAIPEFGTSPRAQGVVSSDGFRERLSAARAVPLVDYTAVAALKMEALRAVFDDFVAAASDARRNAFDEFCANGGKNLENASLFQVLRQHFSAQDAEKRNWRNWPPNLQDATTEAVRQAAVENRHEIAFQNWLQFIADEQLANAAAVARRAGMSIGFYRDLAVGCDGSGAESWANPAAFLARTTVGAPPDIFNPAGQNWGVPPFDPAALQREGYRSFIELIRANMRNAGGLRIDHVMGLLRLYCIPEGTSAREGAYVGYPIDDLIGILALESQRQQCLVVGEDLGTVPAGFRERLAAANILSYRVLFFEQDLRTGVYVPPQAYPEQALAVTGSHDLPTLLAWWQAGDIEAKDRLGLYPHAEEAASQYERRSRDRRTILEAFTGARLLDQGTDVEDVSATRFAALAHEFLGQTPSLLVATQLDEITGEVEPVNIPSTVEQNPNWRRKYRISLEDLARDSVWEQVEPLRRRGTKPFAPVSAQERPGAECSGRVGQGVEHPALDLDARGGLGLLH